MFDPGKAAALVRDTQRNPARAAANLAALDKMLGLGPHPNARVQGMARTGATKIYTVTPLAAPVAQGVTTAGVTVNWRFTGRVLAMYGQVASGTDADAASMGARVLVGGQKSLFTTGDADTYVTFLGLFGKTENWFPINREVVNGDSWTVSYQNLGYSLAGILPQIYFSFLDYDVAR